MNDQQDSIYCVYCGETIRADDYLAVWSDGDAHCGSCAIAHGIVPNYINRVPALYAQVERIAAALERAHDDPDAYEYTTAYFYDAVPKFSDVKSVTMLRAEGWKIYRTASDSDGDLYYYMRRSRYMEGHP
jgi:hypothetical protein